MSKISAPRATDPRPARTRSLFSEALLELIQEKRWDRIRVQDILDRTGQGRSTFYAHFDNKFDLLTSEIPAVVLPITTSAGDSPDLLPLFEHVDEMQPVMRALLSQPLLSEVTETFHRELAASWVGHLAPRIADPAQVEFASELLASGFLAVSKKWLATRCERPAAEVCADYERYAAAIIAAARTNLEQV